MGEKKQDTTANVLSMSTSYVEVAKLKVRIEELECVHSKIKFQIIGFQQENDKLWKEKKIRNKLIWRKI